MVSLDIGKLSPENLLGEMDPYYTLRSVFFLAKKIKFDRWKDRF